MGTVLWKDKISDLSLLNTFRLLQMCQSQGFSCEITLKYSTSILLSFFFFFFNPYISASLSRISNDILFFSFEKVIFTDFKVVNVLAVCNMPFEIRLPEFTKNNRPHARYGRIF